MMLPAAHAPGFRRIVALGHAPVLLVIDMMRAYVVSDSPLCLPDRHAVEGCTALLDAAWCPSSTPGWRRALTCATAAGSRKVPALEMLTRGATLGEFDPDVSPHAGEAGMVT